MDDRNYFNEALFILDKSFPGLKLETFRYMDYVFEKLPEAKHLKALYDRLKEVSKDSELNEDLNCKHTQAGACSFCYDALKKELAALRAEVETLHGERCYICRPEDKLASEEGCSDCDERAGLHHEIDLLRQERDAYRAALEDISSKGEDAIAVHRAHSILADYPKQKE